MLTKQLRGNLIHPVNQTAREDQKAGKIQLVTIDTSLQRQIHHTEAVFSIVREIYGREHDDPMDDLDVNMAIWRIFLNATLRAAVHPGKTMK